ncbi:MAG: alpha/beta fold hydrolase [Bdellovibrionales bacterium]
MVPNSPEKKTGPVGEAARRLGQMATTTRRKTMPRRIGPRPLGLHLAGTLSTWLSLPIVWNGWKNGLPGLNPEAKNRLENLRAQADSNPEFSQALAAAAIARARRLLGGIKTYRDHPAHRRGTEAPIIWQRGTTRLRDFNSSKPDAPRILIIPSLVNRFDILDLDTHHSFLRTLTASGMRPLVVDWDVPGESEALFGLGDYVTERLAPVLDFLDAAHKPVSIVGYCMGGNLALGLATLRPREIRSLALLATPWDFHRPDPVLGPHFLALAAEMEPVLSRLGHLPVDIIQTLFANLQPTLVMTKFSDFAALNPASAEARHFVLCEDWLNDGVPLTAPVARECLRDWYGNNLPGRLEWRIAGRPVDPKSLTMPSYIVVPGKDRIVPPESALPLARLLPHASLHEPMTGHIGMFASLRAPQYIWASLAGWLEKHN